MQQALSDTYDALRGTIERLESVIVAFSGGVGQFPGRLSSRPKCLAREASP